MIGIRKKTRFECGETRHNEKRRQEQVEEDEQVDFPGQEEEQDKEKGGEEKGEEEKTQRQRRKILRWNDKPDRRTISPVATEMAEGVDCQNGSDLREYRFVDVDCQNGSVLRKYR